MARKSDGTRPLHGAHKPRVPGVELATPTEILLESPLKGVPVQAGADPTTDAKTLLAVPAPEPPRLPAAPPGPGTLQMISMKSPADLAAETAAREAKPVQVQLRSIAEAGRHHSAPPGAFGYLAPPRAAERGVPAWLRIAGMGAASLALAAVIALAIWFLA